MTVSVSSSLFRRRQIVLLLAIHSARDSGLPAAVLTLTAGIDAVLCVGVLVLAGVLVAAVVGDVAPLVNVCVDTL